MVTRFGGTWGVVLPECLNVCNLYARIEFVAGFSKHSGTIAVYAADNVDTDRIIPARFLSMLTRSGYGDLLFKDIRGSEFPLDSPEASGASILVVGTNFGCGSSREHAVWAIQQAGFRAVIGKRTNETPGFSDIFRQNGANCGLLLIELPEAAHASFANAGSGASASIDLESQILTLGTVRMPFEIGAGAKEALIRGLDLIGSTLLQEPKIAEFEGHRRVFEPQLRMPERSPC